MHLSRRGFLTCAVCGAAASQALPFTAEAAGRAAPGREAVREFSYADVQLTGGPLKAQYDRVHAHYLALDNDRILQVFRRKAGLPAPGEPMGGWYDTDGFVPGGTFGQYVSGLARIGASTGDAACHAKVAALVRGFGEALARNPNPFPGASAETVWPAYILDKHHVGLIDAYNLSGVGEARTLLPKVLTGGLPYISPVSRDRVGKKDPPYDETYVLPENLFAAYEVTGDKRFRALAVHYMLDREFFDPLARGEDVLPGKHAYSHTIALSSAGKAYVELGDAKYKRALENAWRFMDDQRYASGGLGPEEQFVQPHQGKLYDSLTATTANFETPCGGYAGTKLARYLLRFTGDARYGDGLERLVYNTLLAVRPPDSQGDYPYYSSYGPNARKEFYPKKWPCCSGTLVQGVADYVLNLYFQDDEGVYVNMYAPSQVRWRRGGEAVRIVQETHYPAEDSSRLTVSTAEPADFALRLRIPAWIAAPAQVRVNGEPMAVDARPGRFASLTRRWRDGDVVEVVLPQGFRVEPIDDRHPDVVAVMRGPLMYVGLNPWAELPQTRLDLPGALAPLPGEAQAFHARVADRDLVMAPFHTVQDETYNTYFRRA
jgi:hypothetical protein